MHPINDPILVFTTLLLIMLSAPLLGKWLRVPDLLLLLGAGALLGPNCFGILDRSTAVTLFGSVGMLYIMFFAGLETDLYQLARTKYRSIVFGLFTFVLPQGIGTLAGRYILGLDWITATLLASMFASHTPLSYPLASRLGLSKIEPVTVTLGGTIITNTLSLLVLAVIANSARGMELDAGYWSGIVVGMLALVAFAWWGIPRLTRWFFENVTEEGGAQFLFVLVTVCGCSYLSYFAKMEPIIGAFLAGAALNRLIPGHSVLMDRVVFAGNTLFIPFFLMSVGMLVDPSAFIGSAHGWLFSVTMVGTTVITKYAAAWLAAKVFRYDSDSMHVMFGLSVVQAAATLAAALIGFELKIFDEAALNGAIAMIVVTVPMGMWAVDRYGRRIAARQMPVAAAAPADRRILVAVGNPASATSLLDAAFLLRDPAAPVEIDSVAIACSEVDEDAAVADGEKVIAQCLAHATAANVPIHPSVRVDINVSDGIVRAVRDLRSGVMLIGWESEHKLRTRIFGTVIENLLESCPSRIYCCRLVKPAAGAGRLLVPFAGLAERRRDLAALLGDVGGVAKQTSAEVRAYLPEKNMSSVRQGFEKACGAGSLVFVECGSFSEARDRLFGDIGPGDTIVIPAERRSGVLWTPSMEHLIEVLSVRFPENNLLVAYPPLGSDADGVAAVPDGSAGESFGLYSLDIEADVGLDEALRRMSAACFPAGSPLAGDVYRQIQVSAASYPVELCSGVALLHSHCDRIDRPRLVLGIGGSWTLPNLSNPQRILLVLLSPKAQGAGSHLKSLAGLARKFHDPVFAEKVMNAASAAGLQRLLATDS